MIRTKIYGNVIALFFLLLLNSMVSAQKTSVGITAGIASRWAVPSRLQALGAGTEISLKYKLLKRLVTGVNYSYFRFGPEEATTGNVKYKISYQAYKFSLDYYLLKKKIKPFVGIDFGIYNYRTITSIDFGALGTQRLLKNEYYFGFAPVLGTSYPISDRINLNVNLKLNTVIIKQAAPIGYAAFSVGIFYSIVI